MATVYLTKNPSISASCPPLKISQQEVTKAYFAKRKEETQFKTIVKDHKTAAGETLSKIAKKYKVETTNVKRTKTTKYLQVGEIVKVTTKEKTGIKVKFTKLDKATIGEDVYIVVETLHLEEEIVNINILQGPEDVLVKKDKFVTVQQDDQDVTLIKTKVGNYCNEKDVTNKDDFVNHAIAKVKLQPKAETKQKEWKNGLECAGEKRALLYLLIDVHSENSIPNFKSEYVLYKGYESGKDDSKVPNHFLNEDDSWFEITQSKTIYIYHTGEISKVDLINAEKVSYIYHDKNDKQHDLGEVKLLKVKKWEKKNKITKKDSFLAKMEDLLSYKKGVIQFKYKLSSTTRRYVNPECFAGLIGAMLDVSYTDFTSTGFSNKDGNPGVSTSHINGVAGDILYLNTDFSNKTTLLEDSNFDFDRMVAFVNSLDKFGWGKTKSILSENFNRVIGQKEVIDPKTKKKEVINIAEQTRLPHTIHYKKKLKNGKWVRHHHHIHLNGFKPKYK